MVLLQLVLVAVFRFLKMKEAVMLVLLCIVKMLCGGNAANAGGSPEKPQVPISPRIFQGRPTHPKETPYIAYLNIKAFWDLESEERAYKETQWCTGFIVSRHWVLTAAHCLQPEFLYNMLNRQATNRWANIRMDITIIVGMADRRAESRANLGNVYHATERDVHVHPHAVHYIGPGDTFGKYGVDAALIRVNGGFRRRPHLPAVEKIPLMSGRFRPGFVDECTAMGFGMEDRVVQTPLALNTLRVRVGDYSFCKHLMPMGRWQPYHLCAQGGGMCGGDSGSPLVCGSPPVAVGVDHGTFGNETHCGAPVEEEHYTSTAYLEDWIYDVTQDKEITFVPLYEQ